MSKKRPDIHILQCNLTLKVDAAPQKLISSFLLTNTVHPQHRGYLNIWKDFLAIEVKYFVWKPTWIIFCCGRRPVCWPWLINSIEEFYFELWSAPLQISVDLDQLQPLIDFVLKLDPLFKNQLCLAYNTTN